MALPSWVGMIVNAMHAVDELHLVLISCLSDCLLFLWFRESGEILCGESSERSECGSGLVWFWMYCVLRMNYTCFLFHVCLSVSMVQRDWRNICF